MDASTATPGESPTLIQISLEKFDGFSEKDLLQRFCFE
jgi:hypothetical protein